MVQVEKTSTYNISQDAEWKQNITFYPYFYFPEDIAQGETCDISFTDEIIWADNSVEKTTYNKRTFRWVDENHRWEFWDY